MSPEKRIEKLKKHLENLEKGKKSLSNFTQKEEEAWFIQAYLDRYDKEKGGITGEDFNNPASTKFIPIRPDIGPKRELEHRFRLIKKQKQDLLRLEKKIAAASQVLEKAISNINPEPLQTPVKQIPEKKPIQKKPYYSFLSSDGDEIWVGRSAKDNEIMTFQLAKGNDLWLHISGKEGPHLILRTSKNKVISHTTLQEALQLALHYSGKLTSGEILVTERKWVHRAKGGKMGSVTLSSMKSHFARQDTALLEKVLATRFRSLH